MQSPFKLFRKHQRWIMVAVTVLIMISFGVGSIMTQMIRSGRNPGDDVVIETDAGNLSRVKLQELTRRRYLANLFMFRAVLAVEPRLESRLAGMPPRFVAQVRYQFGNESREAVVFSWLQRHEAARMGVIVDDERIGRFIDQATENKLSTEQFRRIARELSLSDKEVYAILGDELQALEVERLTFPITTRTPDQYWKSYQQLHTRQKIEVAALPVKDFAEHVDAPSEAEIVSLFEKNKSKFENSSEGEYKPGFRQPPKAQLHYLQIAYEDIEAQVLKDQPITDKDIEQYYETKKLIDRRLWDIEAPPSTGEAAPINPDFAPEGEAKPQGPALEPGALPAQEKPAPEGDRPEAPSVPGDEPPTDEPKDTRATPEGSCGTTLAVADDGASEDKAEETSTQPAAGDEKASLQNQPDETKSAADKSPPAETDRPDAADEPSASSGKEEETDEDSGKSKPEIRAPKFKPLDDQLREQIKDYILADRATVRIEERTKAASEALRDVGLRLAQSKDFDLTRLKPEQVPLLIETSREEMQKIADKFGLKFGETKLVGPRELSELSGIGKAVENDMNEFSPEGAGSIGRMVFRDDSIIRVLEAVGGSDAGDRYVFWKVQYVDEHVPKLDELGVREQVIEAWKLIQAGPIARKRAEALAESVRKADGKMSEALAGQTVTGDEEGATVTVQSSPEFSWLRESFVPQLSLERPPVQLGNPVVVTAAGMKFMSTVFDDLKEGETGVVFNDDASVCYVVRILERRPADREQFKNAFVFGYGAIDQRFLINEYRVQLEKRYAMKIHDVEAVKGPSDAEDE